MYVHTAEHQIKINVNIELNPGWQAAKSGNAGNKRNKHVARRLPSFGIKHGTLQKAKSKPKAKRIRRHTSWQLSNRKGGELKQYAQSSGSDSGGGATGAAVASASSFIKRALTHKGQVKCYP